MFFGSKFFDNPPDPQQQNRVSQFFDKPLSEVVEPVLATDENYVQMAAISDALSADPDNVFGAYVQSLHEMRADVARRGSNAVMQDAALRYAEGLVQASLTDDFTPEDRGAIFEALRNADFRDMVFQAGQDAIANTRLLGTDDEVVRAVAEPMGFLEGYQRDLSFEVLIDSITEEAIRDLEGRYSPDNALRRGRRMLNGLADLGHMIVPFTVSESRIGNIEPMAPPTVWDKLAPGQRQVEEIRWVWSSRTPEEFQRRAMMYIAKTQDDDQFLLFAQENEMEMIQRARDLRYGVDPAGANIQAVIDNSVVGGLLFRGGKILFNGAKSSIAGLTRRSGAESAATRIVEDALNEAEERVLRPDFPDDDLKPDFDLRPDFGEASPSGLPALRGGARPRTEMPRVDEPKITVIDDGLGGDGPSTEVTRWGYPADRQLPNENVALPNYTNRLDSPEAVPQIEGGPRRLPYYPEGRVITGRNPEDLSSLDNTVNATPRLVGGPTKAGLTIDEAVDEAVPSILSPELRPNGTTVTKGANAVLTAMRIAQKAAEELIGQLGMTHRLTKEEIDVAVKRAEASARETLGDKRIIDIDEVVEETALGVTESRSIQMRLGNEHGGHFATADDAESWARGAGFGSADEVEGGFTLVKDPDHGGWAVRVALPVDETGVQVPMNLVPDQVFGFGRFFMSSATQLEKTLMQKALQAEGVKNRLAETMTRNLQAAWRPLSGKESRGTSRIIARGVDEQKWYTEPEFRIMAAKEPGASNIDQMWNAYNAHRVINDVEWALRNDEIYRNLRAEGYEGITIRGSDEVLNRNGKVSSNPPTSEVYDFSSGRWVSNPQSAYAGGKWVDESYVTINFDEGVPITTSYGTEIVTKAIVRSDDLARGPLNRQQVAYTPGGHRMYNREYRKFVKQANAAKNPRTGATTLTAPRTYLAGKTEKELSDWVMKHNAALGVYRLGKEAGWSQPDIIAAIKQQGVEASKFLDDIDNGRISPDYDFQIVNDRYLPKEYDGVSDWARFQDRETVSMSNVHGRMFYSKKGDRLQTATGQEVTTLDPLESMAIAVGNISKRIGLSEYRTRAIDSWLQTFGKNFGGKGETTDLGAFMNPNWAAQVSNPAEKAAAMKAHRAIMRTLGTHSIGDRKWVATVDNVLDRLDLYGPGVRIPARKLGTWWKSNRFVDKFRGMAHSLSLGLLDVGQFPLQIQTAIMAATIDPIRGIRAMGALPIMRAYVAGLNPTKKSSFTSMVTDKMARSFGFESSDDMAEAGAALRGSGFLNFKSSHMQIGDLSPTEKIRGLSFRGVASKAGVFFNEAEMVNRITAWNIGWQRVSSKNPGLFKQDPRGFSEAVLKEAELFSANMSAPNRAWFQDVPVVNVATQFLAYQIRVAEMAFGKQLTRAERARLILGQAVLYGSVGVPFGAQWEWAKRRAAAAKGDSQPVPSPNSVEGILRRGVVDTAIYMASGGEADVMFGERAAVLNLDGLIQIGKTVTNLSGEFPNIFDGIAQPTPDKNFADVVFGPSGSIVLEGLGGTLVNRFIGGSLALAGVDSGQPPLDIENDIKGLLRNISSFSDYERAWVAYKLGQARTRAGKPLLDEVGSDTALAYMFGVESRDLAMGATFMEVANKRSDMVDKWVNSALPLYNEMMGSIVTDKEKFLDRRRQLNTMMSVLRESDPIMYRDVMSKLRGRTDAVFDSVRERIEERSSIERMGQRVQERTGSE